MFVWRLLAVIFRFPRRFSTLELLEPAFCDHVLDWDDELNMRTAAATTLCDDILLVTRPSEINRCVLCFARSGRARRIG